MDEQTLVERIRGLYPDAQIEAEGADCNYQLQVVSEAFAGMSLLKRQQSVMALFADEIKSGALHALSVKAKTPAEVA